MYKVVIKDHIMIAHSLPDPFFGPAQNMHGATYNVEATFMSEVLNDRNVVLDIGEAAQVLKKVLGPLSYQNLDEFPAFKGKLTTTEFIARYIYDELKKEFRDLRISILLHESHVASAGYDG